MIISISSWFSGNAYACSCEYPSSPDDALKNSDAVFSGKVLSLQETNTGYMKSSADPVVVTFEVDDVWKGPQTKTITVSTAASSASCGYEFQEGEKYIVYANGQESSLSTGLCSRTTLFANADEDLRSFEKIDSVFNSKNGTGLTVLKNHEDVDIVFTYESKSQQASDGYVYYHLSEGDKLISNSQNFTANELPKTFTFFFTPQNTGIHYFTKGITFNSDNSGGEESQSIIVIEKFSKAMAFNGQCNKPFPEFTLMIKPDFSTGSCVKMDTASKLKDRGWH